MAFHANTSGKHIVGYAPDDTYKALLAALGKAKRLTVKETDYAARTVTIKTGVTWKS